MPAKNKKRCIQKYFVSIIAILVVNKILSNKSNYDTNFYREHFRELKSDAKCYNELRNKNTPDNLSVAYKINGSISLFHMKLTDQIDERIKYMKENPDATVEEYESKNEDYIPVKSLYINEQSAVFEYLYHNESRIIKRTVAKHRYYNEIDIIRNIKHPNIVTTCEAFMTNNGETSWVIMEKMDFALNFDYVNKDITKIKKIAKSVALALKYLHGKNILHNDIKLENIMVKVVGNEHVIKLIDFGCSQILEDGNTWVKPDFWAATLPYVAPETYEYGHYSKQTDIWLLGMTLLFLAEDKILFTDNEGEFISKAYKNFVRKTTTYLKGDRRIYGTLKKVLKANKAQRMSLDEIIEWSEKKE